MDFPKIRATFVGAYIENGAWAWQGVPNPPERPEIPVVTAVAAKILANRMLVERGKLQAGLQHAFTANAENAPPRDRGRFIVALMEIAQYLKSANLPAFIGSEVLELAHALDDLEKGLESPLLKRDKLGAGNSTDVGEVWRARCYLAIAAEVLLNLGIGKSKVFMQIADEVGFIDHHLMDGENFALGVKRWHRTFKQNSCPDATAQLMFDNRAEFVDEIKRRKPGINEQALAKEVLLSAISAAARSANGTAHEKAKEFLRRRLGANFKRGD